MKSVTPAVLLLCLAGAGCGGDSLAGTVLSDAGHDGGQTSDAGDASAPDDAGQFSERALQFLLPEALPPARGNQYADREDAAMLGFTLFFDRGLGNASVCPTCHLPELAFTDRKPVSIGKAAGTRNSPTVFNVGHLTVFFWDGRADSLWSQALFAIESPLEMDSSRLELAHHIASDPDLRSQYEGVFGTLPDMSSWPLAGKPGDPAFDELPAEAQDAVNRIAANVGKALEAYQRKNSTGPAPLDRFLQGDAAQITLVAQRGLELFLEQGCDTCHSGPMLTDEQFHDVGFPSLPGAAADPGRSEGLTVLATNPFNLAGPYADPGPGVPAQLPEGPVPAGLFRTPSLRNVARTAPYGHDGALATLRDVLAIHSEGLSEQDAGAVIAFLTSLNGEYPPLPWSKWPAPQ